MDEFIASFFMDIHQHFIFHKPYGTISQFVNPHKRKKKLLGEFFNFPDKTMAIGRLDVNSEGTSFINN